MAQRKFATCRGAQASILISKMLLGERWGCLAEVCYVLLLLLLLLRFPRQTL
jgi:hypothetical protein